jgi:hypothetical protein
MTVVCSCLASSLALGQTSLLRQLAKEDTDSRTGKSVTKEELVPIDRKTTDSERAKYGVRPLSELLKQFPEQIPEKKAP